MHAFKFYFFFIITESDQEVEQEQTFKKEQEFRDKLREDQEIRKQQIVQRVETEKEVQVVENQEIERECVSETEQGIREKQRDGMQQKVEKVSKFNVKKELTMGKDGLKCIFYQILIPFHQNLQSGDHITDGSQHYLVESVSDVNNKFSAYTLDRGNSVILVHNFLLTSHMVRVEICHDTKMPLRSPELILNRARECISSEWISSEYFVTEMKYGMGFLFDNIQCFVLEDKIEFEFVRITPEVKINEGDHLMIREYRNPECFHSG